MIDLARLAELIEEVRKTHHAQKRAEQGWVAAEEALQAAARHQRETEKDAVEARQALVDAITGATPA